MVQNLRFHEILFDFPFGAKFALDLLGEFARREIRLELAVQIEHFLEAQTHIAASQIDARPIRTQLRLHAQEVHPILERHLIPNRGADAVGELRLRREQRCPLRGFEREGALVRELRLLRKQIAPIVAGKF